MKSEAMLKKLECGNRKTGNENIFQKSISECGNIRFLITLLNSHAQVHILTQKNAYSIF